jgi:hypothetical protein
MKNVPLIAAIIFLAVGGFLIWQKQTHAPIQPLTIQNTRAVDSTKSSDTETDVSKPTSSEPNRLPRTTQNTLINPADVVKGDVIGAFTVTYARFSAGTASYPQDEYRIDFDGSMTFTGTLYGTEQEMCEPYVNIATSTREQFPHDSDSRHNRFPLLININNMQPAPKFTTDKNVPGFHDGDMVEITINHFVSESIPKDCGGDYVDVTSLKKI